MGIREKKLFTDVFLFTLSNFGSKVLVFLLVPLYTNILTTYEYGIADLILGTINILFPVLTLAITEATLRFLLDKDSDKGKILGCSLLFVVISFLILLLFTPFVKFVELEIDRFWGYFLLIFLSSSMHTCFSNFTRGVDKTKLFAAKGIIYTICIVLFNILFLVVFRLGLQGYLWGIIISELITTLYMIVKGKFYTYIKDIKVDIKLIREMLKYSVPMIPTIIAWWIMQLSDKYIIIAFAGISISGIYSVAYKIPSILSMISSIFNQAWQISAVKSKEDNDYKNFFCEIYQTFFVFTSITCIVLISMSKILGDILFAKDYFIAWSYVPILLIAYFFSGLTGVIASLFTAAKKTGVLFLSTSFAAAINLVLNLIFIPKFGAIAAAYTTMIGFMCAFLIRELSARTMFSIRLNTWKEILMIIFMIIQAIIKSNDWVINNYINILLMAFCIIIYNKQIKVFVNKIKDIIRGIWKGR